MAVYNPNSFPTGCPVLTINSVTYKTNSFVQSRQTNKTDIIDEAGAPIGHIIQAGFDQITAELQLAATSTVVPTTAAVASTTGTFVFATDTYAILTVSEPREKIGQRVVNITAQKNY